MKIILPKISFVIEKWKYNKRCETYVSTLGRFKNSKGELLDPKVGHKHGYLHVQTACGWECCHRLVMETFKPRKDMVGLTVDHNNHNKRDNRLSNLTWVTIEENLAMAAADLLMEKEDKTDQTQTYMGSPLIRCDNRNFYSFDSVTRYLVDKGKISSYNDINKKTIKKNILKAIKNKSKYCSYIFEIL